MNFDQSHDPLFRPSRKLDTSDLTVTGISETSSPKNSSKQAWGEEREEISATDHPIDGGDTSQVDGGDTNQVDGGDADQSGYTEPYMGRQTDKVTPINVS